MDTADRALLNQLIAAYDSQVAAGASVDIDRIAIAYPNIAGEFRQYVLSKSSILPAGSMVDRYQIVKLLGRGAMGVVYAAVDTRLGRDVALKVPDIPPEQRHLFFSQFQREAQVAASLAHPNLCPVYDFGIHDEEPFLTMQLLSGSSLQDVIDEGKTLSIEDVIHCCLAIADGLAEMHSKGVIHRDLKPANVLLDARRSPVITDFGLAINNWQSPESLTTIQGGLIGSPAYMSPEQIRRVSAIDARSDLYSLGVILFELATGRLPFSGNMATVLVSIVSQDAPKLSRLRTDVPSSLERLCDSLLAKSPKNRPPTAKHVIQLLRAIDLNESIALQAKAADDDLLKILQDLPAAELQAKSPSFYDPPPTWNIKTKSNRSSLAGWQGMAFLATCLLIGTLVLVMFVGFLLEKSVSVVESSRPSSTDERPAWPAAPSVNIAAAKSPTASKLIGDSSTASTDLEQGSPSNRLENLADWMASKSRSHNDWDITPQSASHRYAGGTESSVIWYPVPLEAFELKCEIRLTSFASGGIVFHSAMRSHDLSHRHHHQIKLTSPSSSGNKTQFKAELLDSLHATKSPLLAPINDWVTICLTVSNGQVSFFVDGKPNESLTHLEKGFPKGSTFCERPFSGYLGLECFRGVVSYRNVSVVDLNKHSNTNNAQVIEISQFDTGLLHPIGVLDCKDDIVAASIANPAKAGASAIGGVWNVNNGKRFSEFSSVRTYAATSAGPSRCVIAGAKEGHAVFFGANWGVIASANGERPLSVVSKWEDASSISACREKNRYFMLQNGAGNANSKAVFFRLSSALEPESIGLVKVPAGSTSTAISADGSLASVGTDQGAVVVFSGDQASPEGHFQVRGAISSMDIAPDNSAILVAHQDATGTGSLISLVTRSDTTWVVEAGILRVDRRVPIVKFASSGKVYYANDGEHGYLFKRSSDRPVAKLPLACGAPCIESNRLVTGHRDGLIRVWQLPDTH